MSLRQLSGGFVLAAAFFVSGGALAQDATIDQVYQATAAGHYAEAQAMMDKVLRDHPNSAKAHYVEAELLARQGKMPAADSELANAMRIDPSGNFAKPGALQELRNQLAASHNVQQRPVAPAPPVIYNQPAPLYNTPVQHSGGGSGLMMIIVLIAVIAFIIIVARAIFRRAGGAVMAPGYNAGYGAGGYPGGYGGGGMPMGMGMGGGGIGSGIVGGLATGAAMGAGLVAGEELMHHFTDGDRGGSMIPPAGGGWDNSPPAQNTDMGGNDFGTTDSGSWDSGGGDSGGGGGDW